MNIYLTNVSLQVIIITVLAISVLIFSIVFIILLIKFNSIRTELEVTKNKLSSLKTELIAFRQKSESNIDEPASKLKQSPVDSSKDDACSFKDAVAAVAGGTDDDDD